MSNRFSAFSATFTHAGGDLDLVQHGGQGIAPGMRRAMVRPAGSVDPAAYVNAMAEPRVQLNSRALSTILTNVSLATGLKCTAGAALRYQKRADAGGTFETGLDHLVVASASGFLWVDSIDADIGSDTGAVVNLNYLPYSSDGQTAPLIPTASQSFAAEPSPAFQHVYFLGPAYIAGTPTLMPALARLRINSGLSVEGIIEDGSVFPTSAIIRRRDPSLELTFLKTDMIASTFSHLFGALQSSQIDTYLWKGDTATASGRVAAASSAHCKISAASSNWSPDDITVAAEDDATVTVNVRSLGVLSLSLTSTIP